MRSKRLKKYLNQIIRGDCVDVMKKMPAGSIDMIFADPPYNLQLKNDLWRPNKTKVAAVNDQWDKFKSFQDYDQFTDAWLRECKRILRPTGTFWVIGSYHNIFRVGQILQNLGFWILNDIIWVKRNPTPNFRGVRFTNAHETLIWAKRDDKSKKYTFNYRLMKTLNNNKQMRSDWSFPICNGGERLKDRKGNKLHTTQKPKPLLERIILASTNKDDVVLDPFAGTGTTGAAAKEYHRNYILIEQSQKYIPYIRKRLNKVQPTNNFNSKIKELKKAA